MIEIISENLQFFLAYRGKQIMNLSENMVHNIPYL